MLSRLRSRLRQRAENWIARRVRRQPGPVAIDRRRIYILPTRSGLYYGLLVFVMLMGSMNYSNSLGFSLTFLLASIGLVCMHHTHRNMVNLRVAAGRTQPVFAGQPAVFRLIVSNPSATPRFALRIAHDDDQQVDLLDVASGSEALAGLRVGKTRRGRLPSPRFRLYTEYPMGLFRAWSWVYLDAECLVYPRPAGGDKLPPALAGSGAGRAILHEGREDFAGLRRYEYGDPPRLIHWKALPRSGQLLVKLFADPRERELWLDWSQPATRNPEARLSQLTQWVLACQEQGLHYGLRLPGMEIAPTTGSGHHDQCLRELALYDDPA